MDCVSHQSRLFERSAHWPWSLYTTHAWRRARTVQSTAHRFTTTQQITENSNKHFIWDNRLQNCVYRLMLWSRVPIFVSPIPFWSHDHWWLFRGVMRTLRRGQHSWLVCNFTSMWGVLWQSHKSCQSIALACVRFRAISEKSIIMSCGYWQNAKILVASVCLQSQWPRTVQGTAAGAGQRTQRSTHKMHNEAHEVIILILCCAVFAWPFDAYCNCDLQQQQQQQWNHLSAIESTTIILSVNCRSAAIARCSFSYFIIPGFAVAFCFFLFCAVRYSDLLSVASHAARAWHTETDTRSHHQTL